MMLIIKIAIAIILAFVIIIALGIIVFYLSKIITCEINEMKERKHKNGK